MSTMFAFDLNSSVFAGFSTTVTRSDGVIRDIGVTGRRMGSPWRWGCGHSTQRLIRYADLSSLWIPD
jgi:hypothetical protein